MKKWMAVMLVVAAVLAARGVRAEEIEGQRVAMGVNVVNDRGYVTLWNTQTGDSSIIHRNMVPRKVRDRFPDGSRVWSLSPVKDPPYPRVSSRLHK